MSYFKEVDDYIAALTAQVETLKAELEEEKNIRKAMSGQGLLPDWDLRLHVVELRGQNMRFREVLEFLTATVESPTYTKNTDYWPVYKQAVKVLAEEKKLFEYLGKV